MVFEKAWRFLKASRQTELGEFHPDFPSSYGPVRGYRAIPERFIPETRQHGFVPQSTEKWEHAHQHGYELPKEAIWAFMAERGYPTNIARKMGWRFGMGQAEGEHDWLTDLLDPVEIDDTWSEEEKKEWENEVEHFKREKLWPPWDKRVNEGLHPTWRVVPIRGDHWQKQRDMSDQGRSDFSRPATGGIFTSAGGEDQRGTDKAAPDWDSYMITEPIPPEALVHGDTNYNLSGDMKENAIEDEMYGNKEDAWKVRGYLQP
jgi:hypothetical protein